MKPDIYYQKIMELNATSYGSTVINSKGQIIEFYEHPLKGDISPVIAVCHDLKLASDTDFFETSDFYTDSEYNPVFVDGKLVCEFELY
jgi:hypothetical protein